MTDRLKLYAVSAAGLCLAPVLGAAIGLAAGLYIQRAALRALWRAK